MSRKMLLLRVFLCFSVGVSFVLGQKQNNVCPTYEDYRTIKSNKRCWYNPDVNAKPETIARRYGFILESHRVITPDGYILNLYRVVSSNGTAGNLPVLIHHGICANAALWMIHGKTSLPFYLASVGYDVWMSNARGTEPSMRHVNMSAADPKFWDYSFHEIALFDVPVTLEYIRKKRGGGRKITFIGHSMGGTIQYVYASMMPDHAKENVMALISIAPVVYTKNLNAAIAMLAAPYTNLIKQELNMIDFYGSGTFPMLKKTITKLCSGYPYITICMQIVESVSGKTEANNEPEMVPLFFRRYPASFSIKSLAHYGQEKQSGGRFQMFDYGPNENLLRYNSTIPPEYDLKKVNVPVHIIYGEADLLSATEDNLKLYSNLKTEKSIKLFRGTNDNVPFHHQDFQFSKHIIEFGQYLTKIIRDIYNKGEMKTDTNKST